MKTIEEINQHNVKKILSEKKIPDFFPGDVVSSDPGSISSGSSKRWKLKVATSAQVRFLLGVPLTNRFPSATSISSGFASSLCAAIDLAFSTILSEAFFTPSPPTATWRDPIVPIPCGIVAVSPWRTEIFS